jgi:hypothetical protein
VGGLHPHCHGSLTGIALKKFIDEFIRIHQEARHEEELQEEEGRAGLERMNKFRDPNGNLHTKTWARPESPARPKFPHGTCLEHLYNHSWSDPVGVWLWVPKGTTLVAVERGLGFPARREEIQRFGWKSKRVTKVTSKCVDGRSFTEVVAMNSGRGYNRGKQGGVPPCLGERGGPG